MSTVKDFYEYLNGIAPFETQEDWDNSGMLVGDINAEVTKAVVVLDITPQAVLKAAELGANLIISHHPVIFRAMKSFTKGSVPYELAVNGINAICSHTPLDIASGGTNDTLADLLGFKAVVGDNPILRFAEIPEASASELSALIAEKLGSKVRFADTGKPIKKVAICTGAGASLIEDTGEIDAFITGDAGHHDFLDAVQAGITLIAAGHYETENPVVPVLQKRLNEQFSTTEIIDIKQENPVSWC
ncbi:MAG: Nif3-like dinuclear metal center hexameric protein [Clostridia bacterium]|nr:Nif3-like dinuclear metal center hexameric protein [Clostridia bacterium]